MTEEVKQRFITDPQWHLVEEEILGFINPLLDMTTIDTAQAPEAIKAEVIGRRMAYDSLIKFCQVSKLVNRPLTDKSNLFK